MKGNSPSWDEVELGEQIGPLEKNITDDAVLAFCGVWGNPVPNRFTGEARAKSSGLPEPIVPGIMNMAIMAQLLTDWSPKGRLKLLDVIFRQPVPHRPVVITAVVTDKRQDGEEWLVECDIQMSNDESGRLVAGRAIVALPIQQG